jgi:biopolymer transport protein ExbD
MSHGADTSSRADPNLTPLLDVVLQLLMFFLMCANFASTQVNESIHLPPMQSARPADKRQTDLLYLNLKADGTLEMVGVDPMKTEQAIKNRLRKCMEDTKRTQEKKGDEVKTEIVVRADENCDYKRVYELLRWCKEVGYRKYQMRAKTRGAQRKS